MTSAGVTPNRELGQHFLVDENILGVIERLASLGPDDRVLEIGAGTGVLTRFLAARVELVHAVEVDRSLLPVLESSVAPHTNVRIHVGDALAIDPREYVPTPTKLVANLPYAIAAPVVVESLDRLPDVTRWCVMVQKEVGERLVASEGTRSYGAVSALVRLTARRAGWHPVSRTCFQPVPNVDSALVALERTHSWGPEYRWIKAVIQAAFSHRRKTLANAVALAGLASRQHVVDALAAIGQPAGVRAEALPPEALAALAEALRVSGTDAGADAGAGA